MPDRLPKPPQAALPPELEALTDSPEALRHAAAHAFAHSPFLRGLMRRRPATMARLAEGGPEAAVGAAMADAAGEGPAGARLRRARADVALAVALADIAGLWSVEQVTRALSDFADLALAEAIAAAVAERTPAEPVRGFAVLALGKHGSRELNYSSDLDLIVLFDRATLPVRPRADPDEEAVRLTRRVIELLQGRDMHGYVARIDLRLRPSPEVTPVAIPVSAAAHYYHSEALPWERAAFIRARAAAGDIALGQAFLDEIRPFVWRRSLDFQAVREVQAISLRIRDHYDVGVGIGPGFDLKRGRGGIREVEFFAQMHQMIFGGRDPRLRAPATLDALAALVEAGRVGQKDAAALSAAYRYLRAAEHRAQMVEDAQTHAIPELGQARESYARFCGYPGWTAMAAALAGVTGAVAPIYDRVGERPRAEPDTLALPAHAEPLVAAWRAGERRCLRSEAARAAFAEIEPALLAALAASADPHAAAARFDRFLSALPSGASFFSLLAANPALTALLTRLLTATPALADALARQPQLFDILLDPGAMAGPPGADVIDSDMAARAARARDFEDLLERVRRVVAERRFQLGAQLLEGRADALAAGRAYADLADTAVRTIAPAVERQFAEKHGRIQGSGLIVVAMGRYGGRLLTSRSDLDLVLLHSGAADAQSDGDRPLWASVYWNRLGQRLTAALSVPTASGALYEVDTRLRPSGSKGVLVASLGAFERYQREEAWTAEHMALTRARVAYASAADQAAVDAAIGAVLTMPRDPARVRADAIKLRADIAAHKRGGGPLDVKLGAGGLVDLEFVVQAEQLTSGVGLTPDLREAIEVLAATGRLDPALGQAHALMTRVLVLARLVFVETSGKVGDPPPEAIAFIARGAGCGDREELRAVVGRAKARVRAEWRRVFGETREEDG